MYSLDSNKSVEPKSIHTSVLKLLENDISNQLAAITKICVFPTILKVAKVVPAYQKDSKVNF